MTPVEATSTCSAGQPTSRAVSDAMSLAAAIPSSPVQALAQPLLATIARARPPERARCSRETRTGAACALLVVKTAAAVAGTSDTTSARSRPLALMPALTPAARKPCGVVTPPDVPRRFAVVTPVAVMCGERRTPRFDSCARSNGQERRVQPAERLVGLGLRDDERREQPDDRLRRAIDDHALSQPGRHDRGGVPPELQAPDQADAAHFPDEGVPGGDGAQPVFKEPADAADVVEHPALGQFTEETEGRAAGQEIPAVGAAVIAVRNGCRDLVADERGADGHAAAKRLPDRDELRLQSQGAEVERLARAPQAALDFVRDEQGPGL